MQTINNICDRTDRLKKTTSERQMRRVSSQDVSACVVVKKGDASDAGEILQVRDRKRELQNSAKERRFESEYLSAWLHRDLMA